MLLNQIEHVYDEIPAGTIDGTNTVFTLIKAPNPPFTLDLVRNGISRRGGGNDFTLTGNVITYVVPPKVGDTHVASYEH